MNEIPWSEIAAAAAGGILGWIVSGLTCSWHHLEHRVPGRSARWRPGVHRDARAA